MRPKMIITETDFNKLEYNIDLDFTSIYLKIFTTNLNYHKTSSISRTLVGNKIVDNSDVVGASPVGAAPTTSSFST